MKAGMVESQFAILEEPVGAIVVDIAQPPESIVMEILRKLKDWVKVLD
jgi:gluconate kinase